MNKPCAAGLLLVLLTSASLFASVQRRSCTADKEYRALDEADSLRTWDALYRSYRLYRECDDGAIAEGYDESVARILVDQWSSLPRLASLAGGDAAFRLFVLRHINAVDDSDDLKKIRASAKTHCPNGLTGLCAVLSKKADAALKP
jgi:hypothetical protein